MATARRSLPSLQDPDKRRLAGDENCFHEYAPEKG